ncbi:MAG: hypothetical protein K2L93_07605, partial [Muribaculaceae bacterium]|nr:hypothetical protein [Muribaculaceae bacterium]
MGEYDDIMNLPYKGVKLHQPMKMEMRAAQFAPFAALTGHNAAIAATAQSHIEAYNKSNIDDDEQNEYRHDT